MFDPPALRARMRHSLFPADESFWYKMRSPLFTLKVLLVLINFCGINRWVFVLLFGLINRRCEYQLLHFLATAQLWDPETDVWTELPPMTKGRSQPAGCVLPDGRFVVVGGHNAEGVHRDGEVYDCARNEWKPLPAPNGTVGGGRQCAALVPVAGGMLILGGDADDRSAEGELWDEESRQWLKLPHGMSTCCRSAAVSVPAAALCKAPATS